MKKAIISFLLLSGIPFFSLAHEGHGHTHGFTITHYIIEPEHALLTWLVVAFTIGYIWLKRRKKANQ